MKPEIISIGTELLLGEVLDTNANFVAGQLPLLGMELRWVSQVGDYQADIVEAIKRALERSDLILMTGGLGPTGDDLTREAIAEALGEEIVADPVLVQELRQFFGSRHAGMPESNLKQATLIPSAKAIPNPRGTAPGWWVEKGGCIIIAMPGPPHEMEYMWSNHVFPQLQKYATEVVLFKTFKTFGLGEAAVGELVNPMFASLNPVLGIYAKPDGVQLRLIARGKNKGQAEELIAQGEARIRAVLSDHIWGIDDDTLAAVVGKILHERHLSIATMESLTGGMLGSAITDVSGSSNYFLGGLIAYSNEAKVAHGVPAELIARHGAVSAEVAQAMASAARARFGANIGLSTTGVAGPHELELKPVGTVFIGMDFDNRKNVIARSFFGDRLQIKHRVVYAALLELRKMLIA